MKSVIIIDEYLSSKTNGVGTYVRLLLRCMKNKAIEINLISYNAPCGKFLFFDKNGIRNYYFPMNINAGYFLKSGELSFSILSLYLPDSANNVFFVNHSPSAQFLSALRLFYKKSKIVYTIHDQIWTSALWGNKLNLLEILSSKTKKRSKTVQFIKYYFREEQEIYKNADFIICLTRSTFDLVQNTYNIPVEKIRLIPNGVEIKKTTYSQQKRDTLRCSMGIRKEDTVLLFVGRPTSVKGFNVLIEAVNSVYKHHSSIRLIVAGDFYNTTNIDYLPIEVCARIIFVGHVSKSNLEMLYKISDIGVIPSYTEQCSFVALEMMVSKLLVLTSNGYGLSDMFQNNINAFIAPISPAQNGAFKTNLTNTILRIINSPKCLRDKIRNNAFQYVCKYHDINRMKDNYQQFVINM